jgi:hypothetical protein
MFNRRRALQTGAAAASTLAIPRTAFANPDAIYVFHRGPFTVGKLWYKVFKGTKWTGDITQIEQTDISASPSAVVFNSTIYVLKELSGQLSYNVFDGLSWAGEQNVGVTILESPGAVVYFNPFLSKNMIYVFHQGGGAGGRLDYTAFDGTLWETDTPVPNTGMSGSPSAVVYNGKIYVFHKGQGSTNEHLWFNTFDGSNWGGDQQVPGLLMSESPSACLHYDTTVSKWKIYVFHQGSGGGTLWYTSFDGSVWATDRQVTINGISASPSAVSYHDKIYVFHHGTGTGSDLWYNVFDPSSGFWAGDQQIPTFAVSGSPTAIVW